MALVRLQPRPAVAPLTQSDVLFRYQTDVPPGYDPEHFFSGMLWIFIESCLVAEGGFADYMVTANWLAIINAEVSVKYRLPEKVIRLPAPSWTIASYLSGGAPICRIFYASEAARAIKEFRAQLKTLRHELAATVGGRS